MPTFDTPEPISATVELEIGDAEIVAGDRADTVVQVRPSDTTREADVRAAEQTRVEFSAGRLLVRAPRQRGLGTLFGRPGAVDVTIELPAGSQLQGRTAVGRLRSTGRLGDCRVRSTAGDIQLDQTGNLDADTGAGAVAVDRVSGRADVTAGSGRVRLGAVEGAAVVKNSNGDSWIGEIAGELRANCANGSIVVDRAASGVTANTANGDVRIGAVSRGLASLKTARGQIEIGIQAGTTARLDVLTQYGRVRQQLDAADGPAGAAETVEVYARTGYGDILVRRA